MTLLNADLAPKQSDLDYLADRFDQAIERGVNRILLWMILIPLIFALGLFALRAL